MLTTTDLLTLATVCSALRELSQSVIKSSRRLVLCGTPIRGTAILQIASGRFEGHCERLDVSGCENLTKAEVCRAAAALPSLTHLAAKSVGPGSWSGDQLAKLLDAAPQSATSICVDARAEMKKDLGADSTFLRALMSPILRVEKCTLIADCVGSVATAGTQSSQELGSAEMVAASMAGLELDERTTSPTLELGISAAEQIEPSLRRLYEALECQAACLYELDASSGALSRSGAAEGVVAPLLRSPSCQIRTLKLCSIASGAMNALAPALCANESVRSAPTRPAFSPPLAEGQPACCLLCILPPVQPACYAACLLMRAHSLLASSCARSLLRTIWILERRACSWRGRSRHTSR